MFLPLIPALLGSHLLIAATGAVPAVDMQKSCRDSASALYASGSITNDVDNCISEEQAAREQLVKDWATFPANTKAHCVLPAEYLPSYIEWLTCLQMEGDIKKIRDEQPAANAARARTAGHTAHDGAKKTKP
jgi:hypothetical protein